jgi:hypothetical protein
MAYTTINKSTDYFNTKLYTGTGASQSITGVGFQPDWTWIKRREVNWHCLVDAVRGATKRMSSNETNAEVTDATAVTSLDSDGFTVGIDSSAYTNQSGGTYASWNWLANGAGSANTDGSITSTVSANTTSGFSIVSYTGTGANATVGHGLGVTPKMIIIKDRSDGYNWIVYNQNIGNTGFLRLDTTNALDTGINMFQNTNPTSSVFSISSHGAVNASGDNIIAYCFADVTGYSKFGSYIGNANADGPFIYTGFKPAFVIAKLTSVAGENWYLWDNKRSTGNVVDKFLYPNLPNAEVDSTNFIDFLSNGFKLRSASDVLNGSGNTHIYMAFAEAPLVGTNNVPANAR